MPRKSTLKIISKKKSSNTRRPSLNAAPLYKPLFVKLGLAFPPFLEVQHKYVDEFTLTGTTGVMANYRFRATGMFDPNHTAGGHQPAYYDNLTAIYDHWIVTQASIELTILNPTSTSTPTAIGLAQNDDVTTGPTTFVQYEESAKCKVTYFTPDPATPPKLKMIYNLDDTFPFDASTSFYGSAGADPTEETIFNVFLQSVDMTSTATAFIVARIVYTAVWFELKDIVTS